MSMKKIYQTPQTEAFAIELQTIIAGTTLNAEDAAPTVEVTDGEYHSTFGARGSVLDDEEW